MAAVRLAMGAFPLFASGPAGAKAHAPLNGGVCVCGGKERLAACLWQGAVCLLRAGILPHKAAAPSAAAKGNRQPLCRKPLFGRGGFRPCHGRNAPAPFMCAHWLLKKECCDAGVFFFGRNVLWPGPGQGGRYFLCACARAVQKGRCGAGISPLRRQYPSARPRPRRPALAMHGPGAQASGRNNSAQAPPCGRFESASLPPCSRAASSAMARPRPMCAAAGLRAASPE